MNRFVQAAAFGSILLAQSQTLNAQGESSTGVNFDLFEEIRRTEEAIANLPPSRDNFDFERVELWYDLGDLYLSNEDYPNALAQFDRVLMATKNEYGLGTYNEIPVLEKLITTNMRMGRLVGAEKFRRAKTFIEYAGTIMSEPGEINLDIVHSLENIGDSSLELFLRKFEGKRRDHLLNAYKFQRMAFEQVKSENAPNFDLATLDRTSNKLLEIYLHIDTYNARIEPSSLIPVLDVNSRSLIQDMTILGEAILGSLVKNYTNLEPLNVIRIANNLANLADWHLIFGNEEEANAYYGRVFTQLNEGEFEREVFDNIFDPSIPVYERFGQEAVGWKERLRRPNVTSDFTLTQL